MDPLYYQLIILTFVVTALWDVVLRFMSLNYEHLPNIIKIFMPFIGDLKPYFKIHTLLAAALIAGFVGATTQAIILLIMSFPRNLKNIPYIIKFFTLSFVISALFGLPMKWTNLFPHLETYYYNKLGLIRGMYHDGISGFNCTKYNIIFILCKSLL